MEYYYRPLTLSLVDAIRLSDYDGVKAAIDRGEALNSKSEHHFYPLEFAVLVGNVPIIELLLDRGARLDLPDIDIMRRAMYYMRSTDAVNVDVINLLLNRGAVIDFDSVSGITNLNTIQVLLDRGITEVDHLSRSLKRMREESSIQHPDYQYPPIEKIKIIDVTLVDYITRDDLRGRVEEVLKMGADPNSLERLSGILFDRFTLSHITPDKYPGLVELFNTLIRYGLDVTEPQEEEEAAVVTSVAAAAAAASPTISAATAASPTISAATAASPTITAAATDIAAAASTDTDTVISADTTPPKRNNYWGYAILANIIPIKYFPSLQRRQIVKIRNRTAAHMFEWALRERNDRLIEMMWEAEFNVNSRTREGFTPLYFAIVSFDYKPNIILKLLQTGANINHNKPYGYLSTVVVQIGRVESPERIRFTGMSEESVLARRNELLEVIDMLLEYGIDFKSEDLIPSLAQLTEAARQLVLDKFAQYDMFVDPVALKEEVDNFMFKRALEDETLDVPRYPASKRPITEMKFSSKPCLGVGPTLPVTRYDKLYHNASALTTAPCSTFYFYEPNSPYQLVLGNCLVAASKYDAFVKLGGVVTRKITRGLAYSVPAEMQAPFFQRLVPNESSVGGYDYTYIVHDDMAAFFGYPTEQEFKVNSLMRDAEGDPIGFGYDMLDFDLCKLAKAAGYDTVIFQREPGSGKISTEVMDVRDREFSYESICTATDPKYAAAAQLSQYPLIWFPDYGFTEQRGRIMHV